MKFNRIKNVYQIENYVIICEFEKGKKKYDLKPLIKKYKIFKKLEENKQISNCVKVDIGGYGISWNEEIDIAAEEIWENGEDICSDQLYYNSKKTC